MKSLTAASLIQFLVIFALRSTNDQLQVEATVGLYGPDRYEGLPEICLLPMDFGYCRAKVQRYYFDIRRMKCQMFFWGGCAGNENNFKTLEECNNFCTSPYEKQYNNDVVVPVKKERSESRGSSTIESRGSSTIESRGSSNIESRGSGNTKYNTINSRDSVASKSVPKFALKPNVTSKETGYKGSFKASAKSFNVNPPSITKASTNISTNNSKPLDIIDDEEDYDD